MIIEAHFCIFTLPASTEMRSHLLSETAILGGIGIRQMEWHGCSVGKCAVGCLSVLDKWEEGVHILVISCTVGEICCVQLELYKRCTPVLI